MTMDQVHTTFVESMTGLHPRYYDSRTHDFAMSMSPINIAALPCLLDKCDILDTNKRILLLIPITISRA